MTAGWNEAVPAPAPAPSVAGWLRLGLRAPLVLAVTGLCLAAFLLLRAVDTAGRRLGRRGRAPLAPLALRAWGRMSLALLGLRLVQQGAPLREAGALVANHASWLDIVVLTASAPACFVSKSEVSEWPVIGAIGKAVGTVFIDRRAIESRRQSALLAARLGRGELLCLFPEGTSTDGRRVLAFKSALFGVFLDAGAAHDRDLWVQPISIRYLPAPGLPETFYAWWGAMDFAGHLSKVLAVSRGGRVRVCFHPPLRARDHSDRKALARAAQRVVAAGFADCA